MLVSRYAQKTIMTDYQQQVMKLMRKNITSFTPGPGKLYYAKLDWYETKIEDI